MRFSFWQVPNFKKFRIYILEEQGKCKMHFVLYICNNNNNNPINGILQMYNNFDKYQI